MRIHLRHDDGQPFRILDHFLKTVDEQIIVADAVHFRELHAANPLQAEYKVQSTEFREF